MNRKAALVKVVAVAAFAYILVAGIVFALRHPWLTKTEQPLFTWRMLVFGTVDPSEVQSR